MPGVKGVRARKLSKGDDLVREGNLQENLGQLANATRVEILVMDSHLRPAGSNVFRSAENDQFVTELERDANLPILRVSPHGPEGFDS